MIPADHSTQELRGPVAYMARHGVAANLLVIFIVAAGVVSFTGLTQEAFPVLPFNHIEVAVRYPGATPSEVESSIVVKIEEEIGSLEGVEEVTAVAAEGVASVMAELATGADMGRTLDEIEAAVGRIQTLPAGAERAEVREMTNRQSMLRLILHGDVPERALKALAYRTENEIAALPGVSHVETSGVRRDEISIEVPLSRLRALDLTLEDVAAAVRAGSLELSAGSIETRDRAVRVRTLGRSYNQHDFENIIVLAPSDGAAIRIRDIATVRDTLQAADLINRYQGRRAAFIEVHRAAGERVLDVAATVKDYLAHQAQASLPPGIGIVVWNDDADIYTERIGLLLKNGALGLFLVLVGLALFLEARTALWVATGIAVSGLGALPAMLVFDVSLSSISAFAFILAIGIVVDDAIVVAENVHSERRRGASGVRAAIRGAQRIQRPLIFAVLTTVAAFSPLLFLPGGIGDVMVAVPIIMISMVIVSLIESLLVLPNHLSHLPGPDRTPRHLPGRGLAWIQARVEVCLRWVVDGPLDRGLRLATGRPAVVVAAAVAAIILSVSLVPAGIIGVIFAQGVAGDLVTASLELPAGTPAPSTFAAAQELEAAGRRAGARLAEARRQEADAVVGGVSLTVGMKARQGGGGLAQEPSLNPQPNVALVEFEMADGVAAQDFLAAWRDEAGPLAGAGRLTFTAELIDLGRPVEAVLSHPDPERLAVIGAAVVKRLLEMQGVFDVRSDHVAGIGEIQIELRPEARALGLTLDSLARQVRAASFGEEALRVQRGREEVRVYVRLPPAERNDIDDVERIWIRTPGAEVPLSRVASLRMGSSPASIRRRGGQRIVTVSADVDAAVVTGGEVTAFLDGSVLPDLVDANPGLTYRFGGAQQQQIESLGALGRGFALAAFAIYALLAIPLGSYTQPLIVMAAIPFGIVGAILGHLILGISLDINSLMGMLGLSGVVVNDSLVMVDLINQRLHAGVPAREAIIEGAKGRFHPIVLTSLTTFLGFTPIIFESGVHAQFLVPFAASIGFGIAFSTGILMLAVPALTAIHLRASGRFVQPDRVAAPPSTR